MSYDWTRPVTLAGPVETVDTRSCSWRAVLPTGRLSFVVVDRFGS